MKYLVFVAKEIISAINFMSLNQSMTKISIKKARLRYFKIIKNKLIAFSTCNSSENR